MSNIILPVAIVAAIGLVASIILVIAARFMAVKVDERVTQVRAVLPGANCGACGFAGCDEYAEKLVNDGVKSNLCIPGGGEVAKQVSEVLGVAFEEVQELRAVVKCRGHLGTTDYIMEWQGPQSCKIANQFYQGRRSCSHACLGYGDCVEVCQYDAIHIVNGVAVVNKSNCVGCGMCARECPNDLIDIRPAASDVFVGCSSTDKGAFTRKLCQNGCIGCKKCERTCEFGAITVTDNLARIDPAKCTNCKKCVEQCPTGAILYYQCEARGESAAS